MSKTFDEIVAQANDLNGLISKFLSDTKFQEYADLSDVQYNRDDPEQAFIIRKLQYCAERLEDVHIAINYYNLPIIETSFLKMGSESFSIFPLAIYRTDCYNAVNWR